MTEIPGIAGVCGMTPHAPHSANVLPGHAQCQARYQQHAHDRVHHALSRVICTRRVLRERFESQSKTIAKHPQLGFSLPPSTRRNPQKLQLVQAELQRMEVQHAAPIPPPSPPFTDEELSGDDFPPEIFTPKRPRLSR